MGNERVAVVTKHGERLVARLRIAALLRAPVERSSRRARVPRPGRRVETEDVVPSLDGQYAGVYVR